MIPALEIATASDCGRVRAHNEDWLDASAEAGIAVLADGLGGHNAGEVASEMAVRSITRFLLAGRANQGDADSLSAQSLVASSVDYANTEIFQAAARNPAYHGMGTTIVATLWNDDSMTVAHVGDSRLYRFRDGKLKPLTRDHTEVQKRVDGGLLTPAQARSSTDRHMLTRAVGTDRSVAVDCATHDVLPNDVYVLCSDGVHDMLGDGAIEAILAESAASVSGAAGALIERANAAGGHDNASAIVVRVCTLRRDEGA